MKPVVLLVLVVVVLTHSTTVQGNPIKKKYPKCSDRLSSPKYTDNMSTGIPKRTKVASGSATDAVFGGKGLCFASDQEPGRMYHQISTKQNVYITGIGIKGIEKTTVRMWKLRGIKSVKGSGANEYRELQPASGQEFSIDERKEASAETIYRLIKPVLSKYIRFYPTSWSMPKQTPNTQYGLRFKGQPCFIYELYGCYASAYKL